MVAIWIAPTTPGTILASEIFIRIPAVAIKILFKETVQHMSSVNVSFKRLAVEAVMISHSGDVAMLEEIIFWGLIPIGLTPAVEYVVAEEAVHRMALSLK